MSHEKRCLTKYFIDNCKIIKTFTKFEHNGFECYGPQYNLYDFAVLFLYDNNLYYQSFHREHWFYNNINEEYYPNQSKLLNYSLSDKLKEIGYYTPNYILQINIK